jgi:hypothetical protein
METYKAWQTAVWSKDKKIKITDINPNLDGSYQVSLPADDYVIDFDPQLNHAGIGGSNLPYSFTVNAGDTLRFDVNIDTGIR